MNRLNALEDQLNDMKSTIEFGEAVTRLSKNADFRKVVIEGFFIEDCARYARESGDPALTPEQRADALNIAQAAGHFKRFLNIAIQKANIAEHNKPDLLEAIEEERVLDTEHEHVPAQDDIEEIND